MSMVIESFCPEDTFALGQKIGELVKPGTVISLAGGPGSWQDCIHPGTGKGTWNYGTGKQSDLYHCAGL